ncbi:MAG: NAD(P)H-hydrate dehydratase [Acidimicrobiales bacterium]|nr:NAD(P)H-hydrate dehydratase [Acidimicrobiales bacterium]
MEAVVTPAEMAAIDAAAPEPVDVLIERAGAAVARAALQMLGGSYGKRVVVVAGKGNNGADGRAAARRLEGRGIRCRVIDAAEAPAVLPPADLVVDAAYGTGFRGTYSFPRPAHPGTPLLAVDIPSGVDGLTGEAAGRPARADRTVTFAAWKPGLLLADGADLAGDVTVAGIGLDVTGARAHVVDSAAVSSWLPERPIHTHKWRAAVRIIAGSPGMTGAAHLSSAAALRAGAGYVRLSTPGSDNDPFAPTECVVTPLPLDGWAVPELDGDLDRFGALAIGPGLGRSVETGQQVRRFVSATLLPTVIDGDGLAALAERPTEVLGDRPSDAPVVLTPHEGEFTTLTGRRPEPDRFEAVRSLAASTGAVVLLKGAVTLVARPDGEVLVVTSGDHRLATAGTGDVLTGILAALLARGVPAWQAAAGAAHIHGRAGVVACRHGLVASDLIAHLPVALEELQGA